MKKLFAHFNYGLFFFVFITNVSASVKTDLSNCLIIKGATQRLDCYDTVANYYASSLSLDPESRPALTPASQKLQTPQPPEQAARKKNSAEDAFGQVNNAEHVGSIQSTLVGEFKSWEKGMILKLENGQKWKVTQTTSGYKKITNPKITISKGLFGSFNAKIEGLRAVAKVKRIK